jgi:hypothetical protein
MKCCALPIDLIFITANIFTNSWCSRVAAHLWCPLELPSIFPAGIILRAEAFLKLLVLSARVQSMSCVVQDYIFLSVGRVGSSTELIKQEVLRVDAGEKQLILIDLLSTVQETMNGGVQDPKKVRTHPPCLSLLHLQGKLCELISILF